MKGLRVHEEASIFAIVIPESGMHASCRPLIGTATQCLSVDAAQARTPFRLGALSSALGRRLRRIEQMG